MKIRITNITSYSDFSNRCKKLHQQMLEQKELGIGHLVIIEGLIYAYAESLLAYKEYQELPVSEKKRLYEQNLENQKMLLEFASDSKLRNGLFNEPINIDEILNN